MQRSFWEKCGSSCKGNMVNMIEVHKKWKVPKEVSELYSGQITKDLQKFRGLFFINILIVVTSHWRVFNRAWWQDLSLIFGSLWFKIGIKADDQRPARMNLFYSNTGSW